MPKKLAVVKVSSQAKLTELAQEHGSVRVGATGNPSQRASSYQTQGYRGTMYAARTENMYQAENRLLNNSDGRHNVHKQSNAADEGGFVYVIQGQKRN
jgi:hypothetical protein